MFFSKSPDENAMTIAYLNPRVAIQHSHLQAHSSSIWDILLKPEVQFVLIALSNCLSIKSTRIWAPRTPAKRQRKYRAVGDMDIETAGFSVKSLSPSYNPLFFPQL